MFGKVKPENIKSYLDKIDALFPDFCTKQYLDQSDINTYYKESYWGYRIFHSWSGAIHMALSESGDFSKNDYFGQAMRLADVISRIKTDGRRVLEVGCGTGFNLRYLASRFPKVEFVGIDISDTNTKSAIQACLPYPNCAILTVDFHSLKEFKAGEFDVVFGVETLCHARDLQQVLNEVSRVMTDQGVLVVFDGYRSEFDKLDTTWQRAVTYTERSMAVQKFPTKVDFDAYANKAGLSLSCCEDLTEKIMPNLIRLSDRAKAFFRLKPLAYIMKFALPKGLVTNSIAGLLMSVTVSIGAHKYLETTYRKG